MRPRLHAIFSVHPGELRSARDAGSHLFCILATIGTLRPVRESVGIEHGIDNLRLLFAIGLGAMVVAALLVRVLQRRLSPSRLLRVFSVSCAAQVLVFVGLFGMDSTSRLLGAVFYIWLGVVALLAVSLAWASITDEIEPNRRSHIIPLISIGGTLGAITGGLIAAGLSRLGGTIGETLSFLIAAVFFFLAARGTCPKANPQVTESRQSNGNAASADTPEPVTPDMPTAARQRLIILGIGAFTFLLGWCGTLLYFMQARAVFDVADSRTDRTMVFAAIEVGAQAITLLVQALLAGRFIRRSGLGPALSVLPITAIAAFVAVVFNPTLLTVALANASVRGVRYALARPARELVFASLPVETKHRVKPMIDTAVYRGGDLAAATLDAAIKAGTLFPSAAAVGIASAGAWAIVSLALGRMATPSPTTNTDPITLEPQGAQP